MVQERIRVMVVHFHPLVRAGLAACLRGAPDIEVVGVASDGEEALEMAAELHPDAVIIGRTLYGGIGGFETTRRLVAAEPNTQVLIIAASIDPTHRAEAASSGAKRYLDLGAPPAEIVGALRELAERGRRLPMEPG
ncbi:MAG: response regulator transcription factor [Candidatus Dormiibacterota bacterium]